MDIQSAITAGLFVQFVADNWASNGQTTVLNNLPVLDTLGNPVVPGRNFVVQDTIYANDLATDISKANAIVPAYKTIGIVARDGADFYIAIRGTDSIWEWIQDAKFFPRLFPNVPGSGLTEDGFTDMYLSFSFTPGSPTGSFITDLLGKIAGAASVTVAGHSLGAALATLLALDLSNGNTSLNPTLYTLASPRVGDLIFHHLFEHAVPSCYRIYNRLDIVPQVPPPPLYIHVGDETELVADPGTIKYNWPCEHHLTTYLYLLSQLNNGQTNYQVQPNCSVQQPAVLGNPSASASPILQGPAPGGAGPVV